METTHKTETAIIARRENGRVSVVIGSPEYGIWTPSNLQNVTEKTARKRLVDYGISAITVIADTSAS